MDEFFDQIMLLATKRWREPMALSLAGSEHGGADFSGRGEEACDWLFDHFHVRYRYDADEKVCYPVQEENP